MTSSKRYELLKDTIGQMASNCWVVEAGEELSLITQNKYSTKSGWYFDKGFVESHPEWFRLLPDKPAKEETFTWNDISVSEFARTGMKIHEFKQKWHKCKYCEAWSVQPDEECYANPRKANDGLNSEGGKEKIVVSFINPAMTPNVISMRLSQYITEDKHYDIKCAVERVLNNEPIQMGIQDEYNGQRIYLQSEVLKIQEDAWDAARDGFIPAVGHPFDLPPYLTFKDYLQSLNQSTKQP